jgi:hypothetical protein
MPDRKGSIKKVAKNTVNNEMNSLLNDMSTSSLQAFLSDFEQDNPNVEILVVPKVTNNYTLNSLYKLSLKEVAAIMGIPLTTVAHAEKRAMRKLHAFIVQSKLSAKHEDTN